MSSTGSLSPPEWDDVHESFDTWLKELNAWKWATRNVAGLKDVHGLQLALHLPKGTELRRQVFDAFSTEQMAGDAGWTNVIGLLCKYYEKDDNTAAFETWKHFRTFIRSDGQSIDDYIMSYEQCKLRLKRYKMDITERIHGLNLLCGAGLTDEELRIAMRDVNGDTPDTMYDEAKKALKKYFGRAALSSLSTKFSGMSFGNDFKQETFFGSHHNSSSARNNNTENSTQIKSDLTFSDSTQSCSRTVDDKEYESFVAWKNRKKMNNFKGKMNPIGPDGNPQQCHM